MKWDVALLAMPSIFIALSIAWGLRGAASAIGKNPEASAAISTLAMVGMAMLEVMWLIMFAIIYIKV